VIERIRLSRLESKKLISNQIEKALDYKSQGRRFSFLLEKDLLAEITSLSFANKVLNF